jgi:5'-nucleotidase
MSLILIMTILITNDDGIYSPGIAFLARVAKKFGDVVVVAPDVEMSSTGHAVTHSRPLTIKKSAIQFEGIEAFRINGTPADCVAIGTHLYPKIEVVLSGINLGMNLGNSAWHSGTLAAAKQAVLFGLKGIALSTSVGKTEPNFDSLTLYAEKTIELLLENKFNGPFNVNFPVNPIGIEWTRQSLRFYDGKVVPGIDPMGRKHYWFTVIPLEPAESGTDRHAVENNYVSITPLRLDLTNENVLAEYNKQSSIK